MLIYPNPLNANRYVVLNSGHTFHAADYRGTNALLYPRLGDYAVLTPDGLIPGGWYRLAPLSMPTLGLGEGIPMRLGLGRISYAGADRSQFRVAWSGELIFGLRSKERM